MYVPPSPGGILSPALDSRMANDPLFLPGSIKIPSSVGPEIHSIADEVVPSALDVGSGCVSRENGVVPLMHREPADIGGVDSEAVVQSTPADGLPSGSFMEGSSMVVYDDAPTSVVIHNDHVVLVMDDPCVGDHAAGSITRPITILDVATFEEGSKEAHQPSLSSVFLSNQNEGSPVSVVSPTNLALKDEKEVQRCLDIPLPCCSQAARAPVGSPSGDGAAGQARLLPKLVGVFAAADARMLFVSCHSSGGQGLFCSGMCSDAFPVACAGLCSWIGMLMPAQVCSAALTLWLGVLPLRNCRSAAATVLMALGSGCDAAASAFAIGNLGVLQCAEVGSGLCFLQPQKAAASRPSNRHQQKSPAAASEVARKGSKSRFPLFLMQKGAGLGCFCMKWLRSPMLLEPYAGESWVAAVRLRGGGMAVLSISEGLF
ncbi:hypothetical protein Nepgr_022940 [Nepenthes gracilis]|uniref:Uncharacterized protein n=1 Tax=Nepenthes gracilis TaxID=150966 RepID=A0AAD3T167_NEPGR|nr:hypothetical protein Nepgr_022940 [Nepenthes gracilis]